MRRSPISMSSLLANGSGPKWPARWQAPRSNPARGSILDCFGATLLAMTSDACATTAAEKLRPQPRMPPGGALDRAGEIFRRLRAGDDDARAEDEARHAVDAGFLGGGGVAFDTIDIGIAGEKPPHQVAVHADIDRGLDQHFGIGEIGAFGEVKLHQPLL